MKAISTLFYLYLYAVCFLIVDIVSCAFFHKQLMYGLLCIFIIALLRSWSWMLWLFLTLLLSLEAFFYYSNCWTALVYIIPITLLATHMRSSWYESILHRYILLLVAIGTICLYIEPYILGLSSSPTYILTKIFATLSVLTGISWILI
jgi:hypothetical protein